MRGADALNQTLVASARNETAVTPSAALMFHHSAKSAPEAHEPMAQRGVPGPVQFFPTTSGLELTGVVSACVRTDCGCDRR